MLAIWEWITLGITFIIALLNILLIYLTCRMQRRSPDYFYIISLAIVDCIPFFTIVIYTGIASLTDDPDILEYVKMCIGLIGMYYHALSSQFSACIALYRSASIQLKKPDKMYETMSTISCIALFSILVYLATSKKFIEAPSIIIAQPYPYVSPLSLVGFSQIFLHILIANIIILTCYYKVVSFTSRYRTIKFDRTEPNNGMKKRQDLFSSAIIRGWILITFSGLILMPSILVFLIEGILASIKGFDPNILQIFRVLKLVLFATSGVVNPLLTLFLHTGVNYELRLFFHCRIRTVNDDFNS